MPLLLPRLHLQPLLHTASQLFGSDSFRSSLLRKLEVIVPNRLDRSFLTLLIPGLDGIRELAHETTPPQVPKGDRIADPRDLLPRGGLPPGLEPQTLGQNLHHMLTIR